jgi:hypothetical protein
MTLLVPLMNPFRAGWRQTADPSEGDGTAESGADAAGLLDGVDGDM